MPSAWKSQSACRTIPIALCLIAAALPDVASASASASTRAEARVWTPLAELYAARSLTADQPPAPTIGSTDAAPTTFARDVAADTAPRSVNPRRALLLSMLLPGAGELYSGHKGRATGFFVSEGAIWAHFAAWEIAGHLRKNDYIEQAMLNAGVGVDSEKDDYWRLVGIYLRSSGTGPDSYEESLRREARLEFPTDPAAQDAWVAARLPTGKRAWDWGSGALRGNFVETRRNASRAYNQAKFSFALAILNRIASAIDTQILHRSDTRAQRSSIESDEPRLLATVTADGGGRVLVRHRF
jgi:hypothetical protein